MHFVRTAHVCCCEIPRRALQILPMSVALRHSEPLTEYLLSNMELRLPNTESIIRLRGPFLIDDTLPECYTKCERFPLI